MSVLGPSAPPPSAGVGLNREARAGLTLLIALGAVALLAPCLAGSRPLLAVSAGNLHAPALRAVLHPLPWHEGTPPRHESQAAWRVSPPVPHDPLAIDLDRRLRPPDGTHWLGTDELGRDLLARLIHGARPSLMVAAIATALSILLGVPVGAAAGYGGPRWDLPLSRLIEASLSFPALVLLLLLTALSLGTAGSSGAPGSSGRGGGSLLVVGLAVGAVRWAVIARYMRAEVLRLAGSDLAVAARAAGAAPRRVLFRHLVPCGLAPVAVSAAFGAGSAVIAEASLSFLGLGIQAPAPTWGQMAGAAWEHGTRHWWLLAFPGATVAVTVAAFNLLGEGLRRGRRG